MCRKPFGEDSHFRGETRTRGRNFKCLCLGRKGAGGGSVLQWAMDYHYRAWDVLGRGKGKGNEVSL